MEKRIYILAGPNGAGKTTFAKTFIPCMSGIDHFVNADLIAAGLSPFAPEKETIQAGKLMLRQIDKLVQADESFCVETTLAGHGYIRKISAWKKLGYTVHLVFLSLPNAQMAISRVAYRVKQGGHYIPDEVVRRRFDSGLKNFHLLYRQIVNTWILFDNSQVKPIVLDQGENLLKRIPHE